MSKADPLKLLLSLKRCGLYAGYFIDVGGVPPPLTINRFLRQETKNIKSNTQYQYDRIQRFLNSCLEHKVFPVSYSQRKGRKFMRRIVKETFQYWELQNESFDGFKMESYVKNN